ncbi:glycosyltransferase family 61 protein [Sphingomonas naphthae]|uniref:Glycosyltransferase family 61 protein n=1 Tax=Sphingomonas naphthae TaxID=1813468 RepID=A0ABY7TPN2_9SPHN|nr:glycosyltransferase family 61 protein [Sphingomonas naphthae]WCT74592.1 glycosyltransferase family 61 protein [Sphingomonas naphthae]
MGEFSGSVVQDDDVFRDYDSPLSAIYRAYTLWPADRRGWSEDRLTSFETDQILVTSGFVPVDTQRGRLLLNQSYNQIDTILPVRFTLTDQKSRFTLKSDPIELAGRYIVLGGPVDGVWYHWLFNWFPRLLLLKQLRPDVFTDRRTRILVHPKALEEPYVAILRTMGLGDDRFFAIDPDRDYMLDRAILVSFPSQNKLYPALMNATARHLLYKLTMSGSPSRGRRILASRQPLSPPKRRIHNFHEIEPILADLKVDIATLGSYSAAKQIRLFRNADLVIGAHGSDLTNLLFCRPGTNVLVIENDFSLRYDLHLGLKMLCEIMGLPYRVHRASTHRLAGLAMTPAHHINEDYIIDSKLFRNDVEALLYPKTGSPVSG